MHILRQILFQAVLLQALLNEFSFENASRSNFAQVAFDYIYKSAENFQIELTSEPENNYQSVKYELYTPSNPKTACYIEPRPEEFDCCSFNSSYKTIFLIHGFAEILKPGNLFDELKDTLLDYGHYNIIIVDWTRYNNFPLVKAIDNIPKVGKQAAKLMHFLISHTGTDPQKFHCIGHSLGAHVCGHAARRVANVSRVTGLDPGGITITKLFKKNILLKHTDADYVDVIHTSFILTGLGLGLLQPIGDIDFYVNGGIIQKHCIFDNDYRVFKGDVLKIETILDESLCDHFISIVYFINSVRVNCEFKANECGSFLWALANPFLKVCHSDFHLKAKMGFHSKTIPELPPRTSFYVDTLEDPPYCKDQK